MKPGSFFLDVLRGALIGTAEVIPGVSGGTIALVVGIYDRIIASAANLVSGLLGIFRGKTRITAQQKLRKVEFKMLMPLLLGMVLALLAGAALIEPLLVAYPVLMRALFAGMIAASVYVPLKLAGKITRLNTLWLMLGFVLAFTLTSLPMASQENPASWWIVAAAALAVCALVLPGVSGSFLLLSMGMYQPTIAAVNDRDFGYLGLFLAGAVIGLGSFALLMQYLLSKYYGATLSLMAGLMVGSLRALWPWQSESSELLPAEKLAMPLALFVMGVSVVAGLIALESKLKRH